MYNFITGTGLFDMSIIHNFCTIAKTWFVVIYVLVYETFRISIVINCGTDIQASCVCMYVCTYVVHVYIVRGVHVVHGCALHNGVLELPQVMTLLYRCPTFSDNMCDRWKPLTRLWQPTVAMAAGWSSVEAGGKCSWMNSCVLSYTTHNRSMSVVTNRQADFHLYSKKYLLHFYIRKNIQFAFTFINFLIILTFNIVLTYDGHQEACSCF